MILASLALAVKLAKGCRSDPSHEVFPKLIGYYRHEMKWNDLKNSVINKCERDAIRHVRNTERLLTASRSVFI